MDLDAIPPCADPAKFCQLFAEFMDSCKLQWPSDIELSKSSLAMRGVILGDSAKERAFVDRFRECTRRTVPEAFALTYRNAFQDLTSNPIPTGALIVYNDMQTFFDVTDSYKMEHVSVMLGEKFQSASKPTRKVMAKVARALLDIAYNTDAEGCSEMPLAVPTRDALTEHIEKRKKVRALKKAQSEISAADAEMQMVVNAIMSLKPLVGDEAVDAYRNMEGARQEEARKIWSSIGTPECEEAIANKDLIQLQKCCNIDFLDLLDLPSRDAAAPEFNDFWVSLDRVGGFGKVRQALPHNVMGSIERQAQAVIDSLQKGASLESLDINAIGESVLADCSAEDMASMAQNLPGMIPELASLTSSMGADMSNLMSAAGAQ